MRRVLVLVIGLAAAGLTAAPIATARPALSSAAVEGTYEYREVAVVSGTRFPQRDEGAEGVRLLGHALSAAVRVVAAVLRRHDQAGRPARVPSAPEADGLGLVFLVRPVRHQIGRAQVCTPVTHQYR